MSLLVDGITGVCLGGAIIVAILSGLSAANQVLLFKSTAIAAIATSVAIIYLLAGLFFLTRPLRKNRLYERHLAHWTLSSSISLLGTSLLYIGVAYGTDAISLTDPLVDVYRISKGSTVTGLVFASAVWATASGVDYLLFRFQK